MSSAKDPYQPIERKAGITRLLLAEMVDNPPDFVQIQTRSPFVTRDIDLIKKLCEKCDVLLSMTIETEREDMKKLFSPYAPGIKLRMKSLKEIHDAGILTQAAISPILPFTREFPKLLKGSVDRIWLDTLSLGDGSYGKRSKKLGMPELFEENNLSNWYREDLHEVMRKFFEKHFPKEMVHVSKKEI